MKIENRKIRFFIIFGIILIAISSLVACNDQNAKSYSLPNVEEGNTFEIILDAHGGTAYTWSYEINPSLGIEYVTMEYISTDGNSDLIGGGQLKYTFKAITAGSYDVKFQLQIPWESEAPIETNIYKITVVK